MPPRPDRSDGVRPGGVSRLRAVDPLVPVVAGVSLVVYVLHGFQGMLTRDLGIYSYAGQQVADGVPPYLGVLNRAGPLAHVLPGVGALVARLGGLDDVITMRVLFMLMATAAVCVSYLLGRDLFRSRGCRPGDRERDARRPRLHPVRVQRAAREDPDDALRDRRAVGGDAPALVHRGRPDEPGHAVPADGVLQHRSRPWPWARSCSPRAAGSVRWRGSPSADWCRWRCSAPGSPSRGRWAPHGTASTPSTVATPSPTRLTPSASWCGTTSSSPTG